MTLLSLIIAFLACISNSWNAAQASIGFARHRLVHVTVVILVIMSLLTMALSWPTIISRLIGFSLLTAAAYLGMQVHGRRRLFCTLQAIFGLIAAAGLPFAAA
jgi:hypothetical protein